MWVAMLLIGLLSTGEHHMLKSQDTYATRADCEAFLADYQKKERLLVTKGGEEKVDDDDLIMVGGCKTSSKSEDD